MLSIIKTTSEDVSLSQFWLTILKCESRIADMSGPHLLRKFTTWWINIKKALMDLQLDHPVMGTVFASTSPGGGSDTFITLRRLLLAQAPPSLR